MIIMVLENLPHITKNYKILAVLEKIFLWIDIIENITYFRALKDDFPKTLNIILTKA